MKKIVAFLPILFALLVSCSEHNKPALPAVFEPWEVTARGYKVPQDSLSEPDVIPAGKPTIVKVGKLKEAQGVTNVRLAVEPKDIRTLKPAIAIMGENGYELPISVEAIQNPVFCKAPHVVLAKDAYIKDINPQNFSSFSKLQGLRSDQVRSMIQDRMDNLWLATDDGVTKYDGKYFSHYTTNQGLKNSLILSVFQDREGNLWFGTSGGGATRYDGRYLTNFTTKEGLLDDIVNCVFQDDIGNVWLGTSGGAVKFDGKYFTNYTIKQGLGNNDVRAILQDNSGKIWLASNGGGVSVFDGKSFSNYTEKEGLTQSFINTLYKDSKGNIWIGTAGFGLMKFDGNHFIVYSKEEGLNSNLIRSIMQDDSGCMWFGTLEDGISKFDGKYFTSYTVNEGLSSNTIRTSLQDKNGKIWFGTRGGGLSRFDGNEFTHVSNNEGLSNSRVMSILLDKSGDTWFGTFGGYVTKCSCKEENGLKQNYYSVLGHTEGLKNSRVYSIIQDKEGSIWFGSDGGGISKFDGKTTTTYTQKQGLANNLIRKIYQDSDGILWIATYGGGVSRFDGKNFTNYSTKQGLSSNNVLCILQDTRGNIWFGTYGGGVTCYDGKDFIHYTEENGFFNNTVYSIMQDKDGLLWFGTGGDGVVKYDGETFTRYSDDTGMNNNYIFSLLQDSKGNIWAGTRFGVDVINTANLKKVKNNVVSSLVRSYGYEDGFIGIGCNLGAMAEDKDGTILIGATDRLTVFHPYEEKLDSSLTNLQITNIQLFNEDIPWTDIAVNKDTIITLHNGVIISKIKFDSLSRWYSLPENLSLSFRHNYVTFKYIGIAHSQSKKIKYQYMLAGLDNNWNVLTDRTEVSYGNLTDGRYTFRVKAINGEGIWSNEVVYKFSIRPPWWKAWWFYISFSLIIIFLIYSYIKYREIKLKQDKQLLELRIKEQTLELIRKNEELQITNSEKDKFFSIIAHDLRSPFNAFLGFTRIMTEELSTTSLEEIQIMLASMRKSAVNLYNLLENLLEWSMMQRGLTSFNPISIPLVTKINEIVELILGSAQKKEIEIDLNIPPDLSVSADIHMIDTVIRNLVSNAVKFTSKGGRVTITARITIDNEIEIAVRDNGIGMNKTMLDNLFRLDINTNRVGTEGESSTGMGLILCKDFVEKNGGKIWVESEVNKGSTFYFTLPNKK